MKCMQRSLTVDVVVVCSYRQLGYVYDDLSLNGLNIEQLYNLLEQRRARERALASFTLHGLGFSANVRIKVGNDATVETLILFINKALTS